ncbi:MAG: HemK/PrmC family methyltransferase [Planctomycetota bacterium]
MPDTDVWTTRKLLRWTTQHFEKHRLDAPRVRAEMLLGHVIGAERLRLYMEPDRPASQAERDTLRDLVKRATHHEPVDYLTGHATFFALEFAVSPAVLIPRPSTETLVEHILQTLRPRKPEPEPGEAVANTASSDGDQETQEPEVEAVPSTPPPDPIRFADLGTGSGAIAITLLKHLPHATAVATDLSEDALAVAQQNAETHGVADRIEFRQGDGLAPLRDETHKLDALVSNPPYIPDHEWGDVPPDVKQHEPTLALRGGPDGLDVLRPLIAGARDVVKPGGLLAFEIAAVQSEAAQKFAADAGWSDIAVLPDHERLPRVLVGTA